MDPRPIRLCQLTKSFHLGGAEGQVVELLRALPSRYSVRVAVLDESGPLAETVRKLGHATRAFPLAGSAARPATLWQIARLAAWLWEERIDLLHVHDFYSTLLAVPAARLARIKVVVGRLDLAHWHGPLRRRVLAQLTRAADHVVANAEAVRRMLVHEESVPAGAVTVIRNGLDLAAFDARSLQAPSPPLPDTGDDPVVVHVANMNHPVKRQEDLLAALAIVNAGRGPRLQAFLVGDGPRRAALQALARTLGVERHAHFLGHRRDVPAIYRRATFGVLCSSAEGLSNAAIEGMAVGVPMVVTNVGGNPELISDCERGLVVEPERPAELAFAFRRLMQDREAAQQMGWAARQFVERHLSLDRMVAAHDALYRRVLGHLERSERPPSFEPDPASAQA
jgi:glycosyltransferase involved in cell wall biosynthesis